MRAIKTTTGLVFVILAGCKPDAPPAAVTAPVRQLDVSGADGAARAAARPERATNPYEAMLWRRLRWLDENGQIQKGAYLAALDQREANLAYWAGRRAQPTAGIDPHSWVELGPNNVGGRTRSVLIHPDNPDVLWAGGVSGGIWHSTDGGASWAPVNDWLPSLAIACLTFDPSNPDIMYAGSGEGFFNMDAVGGAGIYKSVDGGVHWRRLPATADWTHVNRIAVSPDDSNVLLAATLEGGIRRSSDGGETWTIRAPAHGSFYVAFDPTDGSKAVGHLLDSPDDWYHRAVYSTDGGITWPTAGGLHHVSGFYSRIELAYAPSQPDIVYAACAAGGGRIWRSTDGGHTYALRTLAGYASGGNWYMNPIWVDPTDPDFLVTGGLHLFKSTDGGVTLTQISEGYIMTEQPHGDNHWVIHDPGFNGTTNRRVYVGTDGGVWRTDDVYTASPAGGWTKLDLSYRTTQFYGAAGDGPSGLVLGGTQDNGTLRLVDGSDQAHMTFGGDGGFCAIDPTDPDYCYGEYIALTIFRSTDRGESGSYIYDGISDAGSRANFVAPFILDPNDPNTMLAGGASLWRSTNVKDPVPTWEEIRGEQSSLISAIAAAPSNSDVIWVGQNDGVLQKTMDGTAASPTWLVVDDNQGGTNPLPDRYLERILVDPDDENVVYVSFGGFSEDNLWKTTDGGGSWAEITGNAVTGIPAAPINGIARHPTRPHWLYVGTEVGIFASDDAGQTWAAGDRGPTNASVDELFFMHNSTRLLCATHGRGIFTIEVDETVQFDFDDDGMVDEGDFAAFVACYTGPGGGPLDPACVPGDADGDDDIDCDDWIALMHAWPGPGNPPDFPTCSAPIPAVDEWGLVVMALLLLTAGTLVIRGRGTAGGVVSG